MRRCIILVGGLCAGFCVMWILCTQLTLAYSSSDPVLSIVPTVQSQPVRSLEFPFQIPGTTLIAEQIVSYDGLFAEGEGTYNVTNVAALMLYNYGEYGIAEAQIRLQAGQVSFIFASDTIPAGARILVPEQNAMEYGPRDFTACSGYQTADKSDWCNGDLILLAYPDMGKVTVTNLTNRKLTGIHLMYKTYYPEGDFYVGGKTQSYYIEMLEPGEYMHIYPNNYALGYSGFTRIKIDEP